MEIENGQVEPNRRDALKKLGVGAAVAWTAPVVVSSMVSPAFGTPLAPTIADFAFASANTSAGVTVPASAGAGDLLIVFGIVDDGQQR